MSVPASESPQEHDDADRAVGLSQRQDGVGVRDAMGVLELRELVKHYASGSGEVAAVDGVSLTVAPGELVALYGPSGSGKTTLLLLAAGLLAPDAGQVLFSGREVSRLPDAEGAIYRRRELGFVFQSFHLIAGASALDNAALKLLADGCSLAQARREARPWLERVGLAERELHTPAQLSMGERQRVAIARALVNEPRLLLADEPTGNLDSRRSREVLGLLRDICHERAIPGVLVTHDPQAAAFVDRVHTLRDGSLTTGLDAELAAAPL
jgi:putative ABC transport system ATP-binding protein